MSKAIEDLINLLDAAGLKIDFDSRRDNTLLDRQVYDLFVWIKNQQWKATDENVKAAFESVLDKIYNTAVEARFNKLNAELDIMRQTGHVMISSSMQTTWKLRPYQDIIRLGKPVLPFVVDRLQRGDFAFNNAFMSISYLTFDDLDLDESFPSEQDISKSLLRWWKDHNDKQKQEA